jgi:hypothetical protein
MIYILYLFEIKDTTGNINVENENVVVVGNVKGDISVSEGSLIVLDSAKIKGSISVFGDSLVIMGNVKGDVSAVCNKIIINGDMEGDVSLVGKYVQNNGNIEGNLSVVAINFENKGNVEGEKNIISLKALPYILKHKESKKHTFKYKLSDIFLVLSILILSMITFLISRPILPKLFDKLYENPIRTIITGIIFVILFIPILLLLIISILGILLIPFYLIISCVLSLISITFGLVFIGRIISKDDSQDFKNLMIGYSIIIALFLLKFFSNYIPYFDIIMAITLYSFLFTIAIIGIGSVLRLVLKI